MQSYCSPFTSTSLEVLLSCYLVYFAAECPGAQGWHSPWSIATVCVSRLPRLFSFSATHFFSSTSIDFPKENHSTNFKSHILRCWISNWFFHSISRFMLPMPTACSAPLQIDSACSNHHVLPSVSATSQSVPNSSSNMSYYLIWPFGTRHWCSSRLRVLTLFWIGSWARRPRLHGCYPS